MQEAGDRGQSRQDDRQGLGAVIYRLLVRPVAPGEDAAEPVRAPAGTTFSAFGAPSAGAALRLYFHWRRMKRALDTREGEERKSGQG